MHCKDLRSRKEQKEAKKLEAEGKAPPVKLDVDGPGPRSLSWSFFVFLLQKRALLGSFWQDIRNIFFMLAGLRRRRSERRCFETSALACLGLALASKCLLRKGGAKGKGKEVKEREPAGKGAPRGTQELFPIYLFYLYSTDLSTK